MNMNSQGSIFKKRRTWHRQLGVLVCLVALAFALFGHIEAPEARSLTSQSVVVMNHHIEDVADHSAGMVPHHCVHQSQCSVPAILPSDNFPDAFGMTRTKLAADLHGMSRAISPHRHPPKSSFLQ